MLLPCPKGLDLILQLYNRLCLPSWEMWGTVLPISLSCMTCPLCPSPHCSQSLACSDLCISAYWVAACGQDVPGRPRVRLSPWAVEPGATHLPHPRSCNPHLQPPLVLGSQPGRPPTPPESCCHHRWRQPQNVTKLKTPNCPLTPLCPPLPQSHRAFPRPVLAPADPYPHTRTPPNPCQPV